MFYPIFFFPFPSYPILLSLILPCPALVSERATTNINFRTISCYMILDTASRSRSETNISSSSSSRSSSRIGEGLSQKVRTRQPIISINLPQSELGNEVAERVKDAGKEGWAQTKIAGMWVIIPPPPPPRLNSLSNLDASSPFIS